MRRRVDEETGGGGARMKGVKEGKERKCEEAC